MMTTQPKLSLSEARADYQAARALQEKRHQANLGTALGRILQTAPAYITALEQKLDEERQVRDAWIKRDDVRCERIEKLEAELARLHESPLTSAVLEGAFDRFTPGEIALLPAQLHEMTADRDA